LLFQGPADELQLTINAQPAIMAVSLASLAAFREAWMADGAGDVPPPEYVAGHSVGEYAALVAAGACDEATGFRLVRARAEAMHAAGLERPGSMTAVLGLSRAAVEEACRKARKEVPGSYVSVANHNAETQVSMAGDSAGLEAAARYCQAAGARRCVPLSVSAAFHSDAMRPAAVALSKAVELAEIQDAAVPLLANVVAAPLTEASELRRELVAQVARPVLWADSMRAMLDAGVGAFLEFGSGQVLTNLVQRLDQAPKAMAVNDSDSAHRAVAWLGTLD